MSRRSRAPGQGQLSLLEQCLDERERAVLAFAAAQHYQGGVADRVQAELGCSELRYTRELAALLDRPEAADAQPALVAALRALRTADADCAHPHPSDQRPVTGRAARPNRPAVRPGRAARRRAAVSALAGPTWAGCLRATSPHLAMIGEECH